MEWWRKYFSEDYLKLYRHDEGLSSQEAQAAVRMLQLKPGQRILDLACGFGRHSIVLAEKGFAVTGYDLSESFLRKAREMADSLGVGLDLKRGDMREIPYQGEFDAVINMFTAFGFFESEDEDLKVLEGVYKALKPGGQFLMDVVNREFAVANLVNRRWTQENHAYMLEERFFDYFRSRLELNNKLILPSGEIKEATFSIRLYTLTETLDLFNRIGLVLTDVYGDFSGALYDAQSPRMILVASKEAQA
jgi:cyclopropane fatty-acyl-phospholipid synthase-like methyltransferase